MKRIINSTLTAAAAAVLILSALSSCKKESFKPAAPGAASLPPQITTAGGRLVFKDNSAFFAAMEYIDKADDAARSSFLQQHAATFTSFGKSMAAMPDDYTFSPAQTELLSMPPSIQHLLNAGGEVQVGDEIIWYNGGTKYYVPARDEAALQRVKQNPAAAEKTSRYFVSYKPVPGGTTGGTGSIVPNWVYLSNGADARHQREFWQYYPAAGNRKYVHEIGAYTDYYYAAPNTCGQATYTYYTGCYLYIKMEWRGRRWQPAGETRNISYNLTCQGSATVARGCGIVDYPGFYATPSVTTTANSTHTYTMVTYSGYTVSNSSYYPIGWSINVQGTIYQHVAGDVISNEWYNTGFPLW